MCTYTHSSSSTGIHILLYACTHSHTHARTYAHTWSSSSSSSNVRIYLYTCAPPAPPPPPHKSKVLITCGRRHRLCAVPYTATVRKGPQLVISLACCLTLQLSGKDRNWWSVWPAALHCNCPERTATGDQSGLLPYTATVRKGPQLVISLACCLTLQLSGKDRNGWSVWPAGLHCNCPERTATGDQSGLLPYTATVRKGPQLVISLACWLTLQLSEKDRNGWSVWPAALHCNCPERTATGDQSGLLAYTATVRKGPQRVISLACWLFLLCCRLHRWLRCTVPHWGRGGCGRTGCSKTTTKTVFALKGF